MDMNIKCITCSEEIKQFYLEEDKVDSEGRIVAAACFFNVKRLQ